MLLQYLSCVKCETGDSHICFLFICFHCNASFSFLEIHSSFFKGKINEQKLACVCLFIVYYIYHEPFINSRACIWHKYSLSCGHCWEENDIKNHRDRGDTLTKWSYAKAQTHMET